MGSGRICLPKKDLRNYEVEFSYEIHKTFLLDKLFTPLQLEFISEKTHVLPELYFIPVLIPELFKIILDFDYFVKINIL